MYSIYRSRCVMLMWHCDGSGSGLLPSGFLRQGLFAYVYVNSWSEASAGCGEAFSDENISFRLFGLQKWWAAECLPQALLYLQSQLKAVGTGPTTACLHHWLGYRAVNVLVALYTVAVDGDGLFLLAQRSPTHVHWRDWGCWMDVRKKSSVLHVALFQIFGPSSFGRDAAVGVI